MPVTPTRVRLSREIERLRSVDEIMIVDRVGEVVPTELSSDLIRRRLTCLFPAALIGDIARERDVVNSLRVTKRTAMRGPFHPCLNPTLHPSVPGLKTMTRTETIQSSVGGNVVIDGLR